MVAEPIVSLVVLVEAYPSPLPATLAGTWPCPGCTRPRPPLAAWTATVHNCSGPAHHREVLLCASCIGHLRATAAHSSAATPVGTARQQSG